MMGDTICGRRKHTVRIRCLPSPFQGFTFLRPLTQGLLRCALGYNPSPLPGFGRRVPTPTHPSVPAGPGQIHPQQIGQHELIDLAAALGQVVIVG